MKSCELDILVEVEIVDGLREVIKIKENKE